MVLSLVGDLIGNILGSNARSYRDEDLVSPCFRPGFLLDLGISWIKFLRRVLVAGMVVQDDRYTSTKCDQVCRASELPIYINNEENRKKQDAGLCPHEPGILEHTFGSVRKSIWSIFDQFAYYERDLEDRVDSGKEYAKSAFTYLSEESDDNTRMGAIGVGALTGFVFGLRGGIIRKLLYSGLGAYGMSAICYPKETKQYTNQAWTQSRKYTTIGYNFVYGVKKDDVPLQLPQFPSLPKLPSSMTEVWEMAGELGKSASSMITGNKDADDKIEATSKSEPK